MASSAGLRGEGREEAAEGAEGQRAARLPRVHGAVPADGEGPLREDRLLAHAPPGCGDGRDGTALRRLVVAAELCPQRRPQLRHHSLPLRLVREVHLGFGRIAASETEAPNMLVSQV